MLLVLAIEGPEDAPIREIARAAANHLDWPLAGEAPAEATDEWIQRTRRSAARQPLVTAGPGMLRHFPDARWKVVLVGQSDSQNPDPEPIPVEALLIDTTGITPAATARYITGLVEGDQA